MTGWRIIGVMLLALPVLCVLSAITKDWLDFLVSVALLCVMGYVITLGVLLVTGWTP